LKKIQVRSDDNIFFNSAKCTNFEVSSLGHGLELEISSLGLVSKFQPGPDLEGYGLDHITDG